MVADIGDGGYDGCAGRADADAWTDYNSRKSRCIRPGFLRYMGSPIISGFRAASIRPRSGVEQVRLTEKTSKRSEPPQSIGWRLRQPDSDAPSCRSREAIRRNCDR